MGHLNGHLWENYTLRDVFNGHLWESRGLWTAPKGYRPYDQLRQELPVYSNGNKKRPSAPSKLPALCDAGDSCGVFNAFLEMHATNRIPFQGIECFFSAPGQCSI